MNWTHVLAFGLGAFWMLVVFVTASAMRSRRDPWLEEETKVEVSQTWNDLQAEGSRYPD